MAINDYLAPKGPADPQHRWSCHRCRKYIVAFTAGGLAVLADEHMEQHRREDKERGQMTMAMAVFRPKNYDVLSLTPEDFGFLKTRGIALDDKIEVDLTSERSPSEGELDQATWADILRRAWRTK
jgi:hypothetical protein